MYTTDCKDPDCSKCKLAARGQCSEEEIPRTAGQNLEEQSEKRLLQILEQDILQNFMSAKRDRQDCLSNSLRVKKKIHTTIYELIKQLKNRELELCLHVDREYEYQVDKIDCYWTHNSTEKIKKKKCIGMEPPTQTSMVFVESCFENLKRTIQKFGMLKYEDGEELPAVRKGMSWCDEGISSKVNNPAEPRIPIEMKTRYEILASLINQYTEEIKSQRSENVDALLREELEKNSSWLKNRDEMLAKRFSLLKEDVNTEKIESQCSESADSLLREEFEKDSSWKSKCPELKENDLKSNSQNELPGLHTQELREMGESEKHQPELKVDAKENDWKLKIEPTTRMTADQTEMHIELLDQGDKEYIQLLMEDREQFIQKIEEQERIRRKDFQLWLLKERKKCQAFEECMKRHLNVDQVTESGTDGKTETDGSSDCKNSVLCEKCGDNWFGKNWIYTSQYIPSDQVIDFINRKLQEKLSDRPTVDAERNEIASNHFESKDSAPNKKIGKLMKKYDEMLASLLKEDVNTEQIKPQRSEILHSLLREGLEKNRSWLENRDEMLAKRFSLLKEDVNTEKIKSQCSKSADSLLREELEKDSSWLKNADEMLARRMISLLKEDLKTLKIKVRSSKSADSLLREEFEKNSTWLKNDDELFARRISLLKENLNALKIKSQSSKSADSLLREEFEKDSSWLKNRDEMLAKRISLLKEDVNTEKIKSQCSESADSLLREEFEKDSSWDLDDDIVVISRSETDSIPSDVSFSPPLPLKRRFKLDRKPSRLASFLRRKGGAKSPLSPENDVKSESSGIGGCESQAKPLIEIKIGSSTEKLENPSSFKQPDQESSGECLSGSKDEGQGNNPTVALRFSFTKYLEKNPESEWLASGKSSTKVVPIYAQEYEEWLSAAYNQKRASD